MDSLRHKILVMIVGPAAIGKTTVMNTVVELDNNFSYVRSFTTRKQRQNEVSHYDFISANDARTLQKNNEAITFITHPTTGDMYGSTIHSYPSRYNLLDTLSSTVNTYRALPFERTVTIGVSAPPEQWKSWFLSRYPNKTDEASKRLKEAAQSIDWLLNDEEVHWMSNQKDHTVETAKKIVAITKDQPRVTPAPDEARELLAVIQSGIY